MGRLRKLIKNPESHQWHLSRRLHIQTTRQALFWAVAKRGLIRQRMISWCKITHTAARI